MSLERERGGSRCRPDGGAQRARRPGPVTDVRCEHRVDSQAAESPLHAIVEVPPRVLALHEARAAFWIRKIVDVTHGDTREMLQECGK